MNWRAFILVTILIGSLDAQALRAKDNQVVLDKLDDYKLCHQRDFPPEFCQDALNNWVETHPGDVFKAAKLTTKMMRRWAALPLFVKSFEAKLASCRDEDVAAAVLEGLDLSPATQADEIKDAKRIIFDFCEKELKAQVTAAAQNNPQTVMNICHEMQTKKWLTLTPVQQKKCQ